MVKGTLKSSPRRGSSDTAKENLFPRRIQRDVLFAEKVVLRYRCKTRHMLGENCPVATPITEDSSMPLNEQSDTPSQVKSSQLLFQHKNLHP